MQTKTSRADRMIRSLFGIILAVAASLQPLGAETLRVSTVTRPPFSMPANGSDTGFSMDLLAALADQVFDAAEPIACRIAATGLA